MILNKPFPSHHNIAMSVIITLGAILEVPEDAYSSYQELSASNEEGRDPEKSEQMIDPYITSCCIPLDRGNDSISVFHFSNTEDPDS